MRSGSDYLELPLYLDFGDEEDKVTLYVTLKDNSLLVFKEVNSNPIRFERFWVISHVFMNRPSTGYVPAEDVKYFTVLGKADADSDNGE